MESSVWAYTLWLEAQVLHLDVQLHQLGQLQSQLGPPLQTWWTLSLRQHHSHSETKKIVMRAAGIWVHQYWTFPKKAHLLVSACPYWAWWQVWNMLSHFTPVPNSWTVHYPTRCPGVCVLCRSLTLLQLWENVESSGNGILKNVQWANSLTTYLLG